MKVVGITILLAGIIFTIYTFFDVPEISTPTKWLEPWIGVLVIITGALTIFQTRKQQ
ncbi:hypothetical protein [Rhodohalobacter sp. 8-1]|uniref:hypothetical protein n=1 Tax=Rhodohalobacter sp. 8-1 TaxID=3131972 RepID=UPI0030EB99E3